MALGESLLLICLINPSVKSPGPAVGAFCEFDWWNSIRRFHQFRLKKCATDRNEETIFVLGTWSDVSSLKRNAKRNRHEQSNHQRQRTNRSQDVSIDL